MLKTSYCHTLHHDGYIVKLALCIERQPIKYVDIPYESKFRFFREKWLIRTGNNLSFLQKTSDQSLAINSIIEDNKSTDNLSLDTLLQQERSFIDKISTRTDTSTVVDETIETYTEIDQSNLKNINRLSEDWLYLIIKHNNSYNWTFPVINYIPQYTLRDTLKNLCNNYFLHDFSIFFLGHSPICHIKTRDSQYNKDSKIFYYRARLIPGTNIVVKPSITDYAWVSRAELTKHLDLIKYKRIFASLPLWYDYIFI